MHSGAHAPQPERSLNIKLRSDSNQNQDKKAINTFFFFLKSLADFYNLLVSKQV